MSDTTVYLNGTFLPQDEAMISPMDRGFLFGDGIYEVIPVHLRRMIGFKQHIIRLQTGLEAIGIAFDWSEEKWQSVLSKLLGLNKGDNLAIYIQISRGVSQKRQHGFPDNIQPTIFITCYPIKPPTNYLSSASKGLTLISQQDRRWRNCHIKTTSLLGNVLHYQNSQNQQVDECLLYNEQKQVTEASACNVFIVKNNHIYTPPLDSQLLPGITRAIIMDLITAKTTFGLTEKSISLDEARNADELWLTSSTRNIAPAVILDNAKIGDGKVGEVYKQINLLFNKHKFDF
ncbi:aminotransferase class IV [Aliiglaciecola lipolytica]|uniref:Aminodeoxychorismate lyase n=1 Tax=Aliiglaciecola lipolytica E3 TaxID=1127673 RepID=K6Y8S0_9ALTE|nr:aminotransferase class IV [Aliiglaciecola lipolytica]GAC14607.1 D-alanine transaminase [Aliiglaciecola lipolytica E3]